MDSQDIAAVLDEVESEPLSSVKRGTVIPTSLETKPPRPPFEADWVAGIKKLVPKIPPHRRAFWEEIVSV